MIDISFLFKSVENSSHIDHLLFISLDLFPNPTHLDLSHIIPNTFQTLQKVTFLNIFFQKIMFNLIIILISYF
jgi:hypothetical protein